MMRVNGDRLLSDLRQLANFGRFKTGVDRVALSPADLEARHWLEASAWQGHAGAQLLLGQLLARGDELPADAVRAATLFRAAADQGNAEATYNLGLCHEHGIGVPRDNRAALAAYRRAADTGMKEASVATVRLSLTPAGSYSSPDGGHLPGHQQAVPISAVGASSNRTG